MASASSFAGGEQWISPEWADALRTQPRPARVNDPNTVATSATPPAATATPPAATPAPAATPITASPNMPAGIDPALAAIYQKHNMTPAGNGSGFADWSYWQGVGPSQYDRLDRNLGGTGTDQPTGTPGTGPWQNSGRGQFIGGASAGSNFGASGTSTLADGPYAAQSNALVQMLMGRAAANPNPTAGDPIIKNQVDAFRNEQTRGERSYEAGLAEKQGANANLTAEARIGAEKVGQNTSGFQAQLMQSELTARRTEIQQALTGAAGFLSAQQALRLQEELATLDRQLKAYQFNAGQGQQESQFARTLAERGFEFGADDAFRNSPLYGA